MPEKPVSPLKVGVVGCGGVAQIIHLPILKKMADVDIVAVSDIDIRKATIIANRFKVPNIFDDIEEMFRRCELDAAFILTPNNMHLPMSLIALKRGAHLFIEKPAARSASEAQQIAAAARKHRRHVMVGMHTRFRRDMWAMKTVIDRKVLGDIFFLKSEWLQAKFQAIKQPWLLSKSIAGGGVLLDLGIQMIDTSWWLANKPQIESVKAHTQQINTGLEVEDFLSCYLKFSGNIKMDFLMSWNFPIASDRFHGEIYGSNGSINLNPYRVERIWQGKAIDATPEEFQRKRSNIFKLAYQDEIRHFIDFLLGKTPELASSIDEAAEVLSITDAVYESLRTNREIQMRPLS